VRPARTVAEIAPRRPAPKQNKKADVAEHPEVFDHVGLLVNEPPGTTGLLFI
jgi:hypothetical protein